MPPASPIKKDMQLSTDQIEKMNQATDLLFEIVAPQLAGLMERYVMLAQRPGNESMLMDLMNRIIGKAPSRAQPEGDNRITLNILTHGGSIDTYRLGQPGRVIDADAQE